MGATSFSPKYEVEELVDDQIRTFKQAANLEDWDLLEYHLRHYRIMPL
jgi:hypothetical protein